MDQGTLDRGWLSVGQAVHGITWKGHVTRPHIDGAEGFLSVFGSLDAKEPDLHTMAPPDVTLVGEAPMQERSDDGPDALPANQAIEGAEANHSPSGPGVHPVLQALTDAELSIASDQAENAAGRAPGWDEAPPYLRNTPDRGAERQASGPLDDLSSLNVPRETTLSPTSPELGQAGRVVDLFGHADSLAPNGSRAGRSSPELMNTNPTSGGIPMPQPRGVGSWFPGGSDRSEVRGSLVAGDQQPRSGPAPDLSENESGAPREAVTSGNNPLRTPGILTGPDRASFWAEAAEAASKASPTGSSPLPAHSGRLAAYGHSAHEIEAGGPVGAQAEPPATSATQKEAAALFLPASPEAGRAHSPLPDPTPAPPRTAIVQDLAVQVSRMGEGRSEIMLNPVELGRVRLQLRQQDGNLVIQISAERPETTELIRRNLDGLLSELRQQGFGSIDLGFGTDEGTARDRSPEPRTLREVAGVRPPDDLLRSGMQRNLTHGASQLDLLL